MQPLGRIVAMCRVENIAGDKPRRPLERQHATAWIDHMRLGGRKHDTLRIGIAQPHEGRGEIAPLAPADIGKCQSETHIVGITAEADDDARDARDVVTRRERAERCPGEDRCIFRGDQFGFDESHVDDFVERWPRLPIDRLGPARAAVDDRDHRFAQPVSDA
jgi:hypothetical protein